MKKIPEPCSKGGLCQYSSHQDNYSKSESSEKIYHYKLFNNNLPWYVNRYLWFLCLGFSGWVCSIRFCFIAGLRYVFKKLSRPDNDNLDIISFNDNVSCSNARSSMVTCPVTCMGLFRLDILYLKMSLISTLSALNSGSGRPAFRHSCIIRLIPRPQLSETFRLYNTFAISGFCGSELCSDFNFATFHPNGNVPG